MKKILLLFFIISSVIFSKAQTVLFSDDFESGITNWTIDGYWGQTDEQAYSGSYSLTDSPYDDTYYSGYYLPQNATMNTGVDLSTSLDAEVSFYAQIDLETGFDYMYLDASPDGGVTWLEVAVFNGEDLFTWEYFTYSLGAFVGNSDVRLRFRFVPDYAYEVDGMYIDDFVITGNDEDVSAPLILYTPLPLYEAGLYDNTITAQLIDGSGISSTELYYSVDGGAYLSVSGANVGGDEYEYTIPAQPAGSFIDYYITATDAAPLANTAESETWNKIAGEHIFYDDGGTGVDVTVYYIGPTYTTTYAAVRITLDDPTQLTSIILQTYTDYLNPNDSIEVHVWGNDAGSIGDDLITPFYIWPEANLDDPYRATRVDLRDYSAELSALEGDIFIGMAVQTTYVGAVYTNTGIVNRSYTNAFSTWSDLPGDFHFRAVTTGGVVPPAAEFTFDDSADPIIAFTDISTSAPTEWYWTFDDGANSTEQNPTHTYLTNGLYNVCLTASNLGGSNTVCHTVGINNVAVAPEAAFSYTVVGNTATFNDLSSNTPTSWLWEFGDGTSSTEHLPSHTYSTAGAYNVCLTASNIAGSDSSCATLQILTEINDLSISSINIFPNPVSDLLIADLSNLTGEKTISITNMQGEIIYSEINSNNQFLFNVENLPNASYLLLVNAKGQIGKQMFQVLK